MAILSVFSTTAIFILCLFAIQNGIRSVTNPEILVGLNLWLALIAFFLVSLVAFVTSGFSGFALGNPKMVANESWELVKYLNPFSVFLYLAPIGLWWIARRTPRVVAIAVSALAMFFVALIRIIYSDMRLLCGTDAALGAAIGYFAGNPIIGAAAGGIIGVLNFELVSKRLLKLVPRIAH